MHRDQLLEPVTSPIAQAAGLLLGAVLGVIAGVRGGKAVHPRGVVYDRDCRSLEQGRARGSQTPFAIRRAPRAGAVLSLGRTSPPDP